MTGSLQENYGKYYAVLNLKDELGKRKQKWVPLNLEATKGNKRKAEKAMRQVIAEYEEQHISIVRKDILFCDYVRVWLDEAKPKLELITYESYQSYIELHVYPFFKKLDVNLSELTYQHIQKYYATKIKDLSANSLKKHHVVINQSLKKALKHDLISNNPADKVTLPKVEKYEGKFLSVEQGNILLDVSRDTTIETAVILGMMYGLRRSEIAGLKWSAIDFIHDNLTVCHTVTKMKTLIAKDRTKNKSSYRRLPLNSQIKTHLLELRDRQIQDKSLLGSAYQDSDYVCRWPDGHIVTPDYISKAFNKLLKKNGLPEIRLHDLRHSCASYMLKMGCNMKEIADWLGHADIKTAMNVYAHLDDESKKGVANRFEQILSIERC